MAKTHQAIPQISLRSSSLASLKFSKDAAVNQSNFSQLSAARDDLLLGMVKGLSKDLVGAYTAKVEANRSYADIKSGKLGEALTDSAAKAICISLGQQPSPSDKFAIKTLLEDAVVKAALSATSSQVHAATSEFKDEVKEYLHKSPQFVKDMEKVWEIDAAMARITGDKNQTKYADRMSKKADFAAELLLEHFCEAKVLKANMKGISGKSVVNTMALNTLTSNLSVTARAATSLV